MNRTNALGLLTGLSVAAVVMSVVFWTVRTADLSTGEYVCGLGCGGTLPYGWLGTVALAILGALVLGAIVAPAVAPEGRHREGNP